jgi:PAS domain S-box-containing protein
MSLPRRLSALKSILDAADIHVEIANPDGRIIYANAAAENHTGFLVFDMIGKKPGELWGGKMPAEYYKQMWHSIAEEKRPFSGEMRNARKNGEPYWQEVHILPVLDPSGDIQCYLGIELNRDDAHEKEMFLALVDQQQLRSLSIKWPSDWSYPRTGHAESAGDED